MGSNSDPNLQSYFDMSKYNLMENTRMMTGVNAGHYSRELMWNCAERARKMGSTSDPKSVLVYAAKRTKAKGTAATLVASLYNQVSFILQ